MLVPIARHENALCLFLGTILYACGEDEMAPLTWFDPLVWLVGA